MKKASDMRLAEEVLRLRVSQLTVNDRYKAGAFKIPIHLAIGHEAIAVAVDAAMEAGDQLVCSHRNLHYNLARGKKLRPIIDEFLLKKDGLAGGELGSMNLANPAKNLVYTSSILGNNLPVAAGIALGQRTRGKEAATFVVTGDGAMEEGTFYESLLFAKSNALPLIVIVENNAWSMHTTIEERRAPIDLPRFTGSLGAIYLRLEGNDVYAYREALSSLRGDALASRSPVVVEVALTTLGGWHVEEGATRRFIHPHAGPLSKTERSEWPELEAGSGDPLFVLAQRFPLETLKAKVPELEAALAAELA